MPAACNESCLLTVSVCFGLLVLQFSALSTATVCSTHGEVRLADKVREYEGRVEVCYNGVWGSVCDTQWGKLDATVVCKQLGLPTTYSDALFGFGGGLSPIHFSEVQCSGNETHLVNCSAVEVTNCAHSEYAGVRCLNVSCTENDVRLNGKVVQACHDSDWGLVCADLDSWDIVSARVVCQQVGMPSRDPLVQWEDRSLYDAPVILNDISCTESQQRLTECTQSGYGDFPHCSTIAVAYCEAIEPCNKMGAIRLTHGASNTGRLEVCSGGNWGSVCGFEAANDIAEVACRQLNHAAQGKVLFEDDFHTSLLIWVPTALTNMMCMGHEATILECSYEEVDENHGCSPEGHIIVECTIRECDETDIRLVSGRTPYDGRVEFCLDGLWSSVCDDKWDHRDAAVVCRQLGYNGTSFPLLAYGSNGSHTIHLDDVACHGNESKLSQCKYIGIGIENCKDRIEEAGVICTNGTCKDGSIYLVGGATLSRGRVEYCYDGSWYSLCAKYWDEEEARVVCNTLGYDTTDHVSVVSQFGRGTSPILSQSIQCTSRDNTLSDCTRADHVPSDCQHVAGVICEAPCLSSGFTDCSECGYIGCEVQDSRCSCYTDCYEDGTCCPDVFHVRNCLVPECETGELRLVGGVTNCSGRLEVCVNEVWGNVCSVLDYWGPDNIRVVCRQLGFSDVGAFVVATNVFGPGSRYIVLGEVHCTGTETDLLECSHTGIGDHFCGNFVRKGIMSSEHDTDVAISCYDENMSCEDGEVRLQGGTDPSNGRVEVCQYRTWGSVCTNKWDHDDARVVCRQLGHDPEAARIMQLELGEAEAGPVFMSEVGCTGSEEMLSMCPNLGVGNHTCSRKDSAGVTCGEKADHHSSGVEGDTIAGAVVGTLLLCAVAITAVVVLMIVSYKRNTKKQLQRIQLDILAIPGDNGINVGSTGKANDNNTSFGGANADSNPYTNDGQVSGNSSVGVHKGAYRARLNSHYLRELNHGNFIIKYEQLTLWENIGQGEFGIVYRARLNLQGRSSREVAVKTLKGDFDQLEVDKFVEESLKMSRFKHAHVMGLVGICLDVDSAPYIVMPYMDNGSLLCYLKSERKWINLSEDTDEDEVQEIRKRLMVMCCQIASGMEYLAAEKYIHRDLAARNCMIDSHFMIKITDFGLSEDVFVRNYFRQGSAEELVKLPVKWMAPESLADGHFSEKSDVWSYGVTMWEVFTGGKAPYPGTDPLTLMQMLEEGDRMSKPNNSACTEEIYMMMKECWEKVPENRPSFKELHTNTSKYIEHIAGYLEMEFNPFAKAKHVTMEEKKTEEKKTEEEGDECEVANQATPASVETSEDHTH